MHSPVHRHTHTHPDVCTRCEVITSRRENVPELFSAPHPPPRGTRSGALCSLLLLLLFFPFAFLFTRLLCPSAPNLHSQLGRFLLIAINCFPFRKNCGFNPKREGDASSPAASERGADRGGGNRDPTEIPFCSAREKRWGKEGGGCKQTNKPAPNPSKTNTAFSNNSPSPI